MIPAGRTPLGTDDVCKRLGRKKLPAAVADTLPPPLNSGRKTRIWDAEQLDAHLAGLEIPELPQTESPDDLVDQAESRLLLQNDIKETTWAAYIAKDFAPEPDAVVCGVPHWKRSTILEWDANRPGERAGGGRPKGSKDTKPRDRTNDQRLARAHARKERVRGMLEESGDELTPAEVVQAVGITERQAYRILKELRAGQ